MYSRKELKRNAKKIYKRNYWAIVAVCFVLAFINAEYGSSTSAIHSYSKEKTEQAVQQTGVAAGSEEHLSNWESLREIVRGANTETPLISKEIDKIASQSFDGLTSPISFVFKILMLDSRIFAGFPIIELLILAAAFLLEVAFFLLIRNAILIGGKRFFLETRVQKETPISRLVYLFHGKRFWKPIFTMLLKSVKLCLWSLTIIGGIIKYYEYYMIPFILAENPHISSKAAFHLSKEMMRGFKWKTFVLQLSYVGWNVLTVFTLGLVGIFFVNGYRGLTDANLYMFLRDKIKREQQAYTEELKDVRLEGKLVFE